MLKHLLIIILVIYVPFCGLPPAKHYFNSIDSFKMHWKHESLNQRINLEKQSNLMDDIETNFIVLARKSMIPLISKFSAIIIQALL